VHAWIQCTAVRPDVSALSNAAPEAPQDSLKASSGKSGQQAERGMVLPFEPLAMSFSHIWCAACCVLQGCLAATPGAAQAWVRRTSVKDPSE
jgi:hypothetical protein